jgi:biopolymer transport protein ExbD
MPLRTQRDEGVSMNLTPLIDIVFLLIIFFMVGTRFTELSEAERNIDLQVPQVAHAGALTPPPRKREVNVFRDGKVTLDNSPVSLAELQDQLAEGKRQYAGLGVVVRGDAGAVYQHIADVLAACREAGIADLGISVRVASSEANRNGR